MNFLHFVLLDNTILSYLIVAVVVTLAFFIRRILSKNITSLVFKMGITQWRGFTKEKFDDIILDPIERIFLVLVIIFAFGSLNFPHALEYSFFKVSSREALKSLATAIFIICIVSLILRFIDFIILSIRSKTTLQARSEHQLLYFFRDFIRVLLIIFGIAFILRFSFNIDISNLLTGLSIVGAAVALAAKESLENLIASFVIFFDKPFVTGEVMKIKEFVGSVEKIGLRSTRIRTFDSTLVTVPNKQMVDNILDNLSKRNLVKNELKTVLSPNTSSENLALAVEEIRNIVARQKEAQNPLVYLMEITRDSALIMTIYYSDIVLPFDKVSQLRQDLNVEIKKMQESFDIKNAATTNIRVVEG